MASSNDSNSPPHSPFGGTAVPSGPASLANAGGYNHGIPTPNRVSSGSEFISGNSRQSPHTFEAQQAGVPIAVAEAHQRGPTSAGQMFQHMGHVRDALSSQNLSPWDQDNPGDILRQPLSTQNSAQHFSDFGQAVAGGALYAQSLSPYDIAQTATMDFAGQFPNHGAYGTPEVRAGMLSRNYNRAADAESIRPINVPRMTPATASDILSSGGDFVGHYNQQVTNTIRGRHQAVMSHFDALPAALRGHPEVAASTIGAGEIMASGAVMAHNSLGAGLNRGGDFPNALPDVTYAEAVDRAGGVLHRTGNPLTNQVMPFSRRAGVGPMMSSNAMDALQEGQEAVNASSTVQSVSEYALNERRRRSGGGDVVGDAAAAVDVMGDGGGGGGGSGSGGSNELIKALRDLTGVINRVSGGGGHAAGGGGGGRGHAGGGDSGDPGGGGGGGGGGPLAIGGPGSKISGDQGLPVFNTKMQSRTKGGWAAASGFLSGLTGGQGTEDDSDWRRRMKWAGRAVASGMGVMSGASIGDDLGPMLNSIPGFGRGFEGISTLDKFVQTATVGELPALQASGAFGVKGASGTFMNKQMGGNMGAGADFGISAEKMGSLFFPMASAAGGGMTTGDVGKFTAAYAGGEDVQGVAGLIGQQRQAGFTGNRAAEFNAAKAQGLTGSAATGYASQLFGAFRGLSSGSGIGMDRLGTEGRILGMGKGDIAAGSARFQRGMGVHEGARQALFAPFQGIGSELLMAEALQRAGGHFPTAHKLIEQDKAQGGAMLDERLSGFDEDTRHAILGSQLTTEDMGMMGASKRVKGGKSFEFNEAKKGNATFFSSALAERRNEQIDTALSKSGRSMFTEIQKQEKIVEAKLISNLEGTIGALGDTTASVLKLNDTMNVLAKAARVTLKASDVGYGIGEGAIIGYMVAMGLLGIK